MHRISKYPAPMSEPPNKSPNDPIIITCISDTHTGHRMVLPKPSDLLIHCGDCTTRKYTPEKFTSFVQWMEKLPFEHKVLVAGNHDVFLERNHDFVKLTCTEHNIHYLRDELVTLTFKKKQKQVLRVYGSPWL